VRHSGDALGTRCEIKNLNSLRSLVRAIDFEAARQVELLEGGATVRQETRHWTRTSARPRRCASRKSRRLPLLPRAHLVDLVPDQAWQDRVRDALKPMPAERRAVLTQRLQDPAPALLDASKW